MHLYKRDDIVFTQTKGNTKEIHMKTKEKTVGNKEKTLEALWALSDLPEGLDTTWLSSFITDAPDPETAHQIISSQIQTESNTLHEKWRKVVNEMWFTRHPNVESRFSLPITSKDALNTPVLTDARALLEMLLHRPAVVTRKNGQNTMSKEEAAQLVRVLPSVQKMQSIIPNSEKGLQTLNHIRAVLQEASLIRIYKGELRVVKTRYEKFINLPLPQQFYILWHTNMYHVQWGSFAAQWGRYIHTVQQYLPLAWKMLPDIQEGTIGNANEFARMVVEGCYPLWQQEGLFSQGNQKIVFSDMYKQSMLYPIIESLLIEHVLMRYGLIDTSKKIHEKCGAISCDIIATVEDGNFEWTSIGSALLQAEKEQNIPCAGSMLK